MEKTGTRQYPLFSACGLNCGLCPRYHTDGVSKCPGCGGEGFAAMRPPCGILSCNKRHGGIEYCYLCEEYPCEKYETAHLVDSFITHRNMRKDFEKAKTAGLDAYRAELNEKVAILRQLLEGYNDGRRKSFYCVAVNLLQLPDIKGVMGQLAAKTGQEMPVKEKADIAVRLFNEAAQKRDIDLKLNKKKPEKNGGPAG